MTLIFNPEVQNATLNTVRDAIDSGGSAGSLEILSGATVIASLPLSLPSFADESGGQSVANAITSSVATESGAPDGFRFVTSYGATVFVGDIPDDLDLGVAVISSGQTVGVSSYALTQGDIQAREFASTIAFPYSTPPLVFDPTPAPSALVDPKNLKLELLRGQDFESDGTTLRTATYDGANVLLDGVPLFAALDVKALDLTLDAANNALVVFTDSGDNLFVYDESDQSTTDLTATGQDPRIHNDRQASPSLVLSYRRGNGVFYRLLSRGAPITVIFVSQAGAVIADGGLSVEVDLNVDQLGLTDTPVTGKRYFEVELIPILNGANPYAYMLGVASENAPNNWINFPANCAYLFRVNGGVFGSLAGPTGIVGDVSTSQDWGIAVDANARKIWYRDGTGGWLDGDPETDTGGWSFATMSGSQVFLAHCSAGSNSGILKSLWNLGGSPFKYPVPVGFSEGYQ